MRVLMSVKVRKLEAGRLDLSYLGGSFGFDLTGTEMPAKSGCGEAGKRVAQPLRFFVRQQAGHADRWKQRFAVQENDVAAEPQSIPSLRFGFLRELDRVVEGARVGHQRGGGHDAFLVRVKDAPIHAGSEP